MIEPNSDKLEFGKDLKVTETTVDGLIVYDLPVHGDSRGWFKENWQREKMTKLGLPDFGPVQNNVSFNEKAGVTRGLHAEPWDKFVSIGTGRVFGAWVDIRDGSPTFGQSFSIELDPTKAIFVPRGVANGFQTLEDGTVYMYLVNDHWSPDGQYAFVNLADPSLGINWPIDPELSEMSDKDKAHPLLADATTIKPKKVLITGASGQLGKALKGEFPDAEFVSHNELDINDASLSDARRWRDYGIIINAAGYTAVDTAETDEGRRDAWLANAAGPHNLAKIATENGITLVHVSSDYVFDGSVSNHTEDEHLSPLGVYGQTKAAGDLAVATATRHYIIRTSWVIGEGKNFVLTMKSLAERDIKPSVVDDQIGRLTFTDDLALGIKHLLDSKAPFGIYNLTNEGDPVSWAGIAKEVYNLVGKSADDVTPVTTEEYYSGKQGIAPRPLQSTLDLAKIKATGFTPREWRQVLREYLENQ